MTITPDELIVWLIVGAIAGSLTGMLVKGSKAGFGYLANLGIGLIGALLGGLLVKLLHLQLGALAAIAISLKDVVVALVGSLIFLAIVWTARAWWTHRKKTLRVVSPP
jgi:uncharacterized membrane protein YeaQ/YmgE (transglycosylase-associated protein family)